MLINIFASLASILEGVSSVQWRHQIRYYFFRYRFTECNCPKAKPRPDGKTVVDAICDKIGECMCPTIADGGEATYTPNGCVLGGMLFLIDTYFIIYFIA